MNISSINSSFPSLRILAVDKLVPHEKSDEMRAGSLQKRLKSEKVLRNPPIVTSMQDGEGQYVVLDGANRTRAFQVLEIPHILVQVVEPGNSGLNLKTWNQVALGVDQEELLFHLNDIQGLIFKTEGACGIFSENKDGRGVIQVHLPEGEVYSIFSATSNLLDRIKILNTIMDRIRKYARMDRTHLNSIEPLACLYSDLAGLIVFPQIKIEEIIQMASARQMIPAGISRFIISPRALRVNYELSELISEKSLVEKNKILKLWLQTRINQKGVRSYEEETILFDE